MGLSTIFTLLSLTNTVLSKTCKLSGSSDNLSGCKCCNHSRQYCIWRGIGYQPGPTFKWEGGGWWIRLRARHETNKKEEEKRKWTESSNTPANTNTINNIIHHHRKYEKSALCILFCVCSVVMLLNDNILELNHRRHQGISWLYQETHYNMNNFYCEIHTWMLHLHETMLNYCIHTNPII